MLCLVVRSLIVLGDLVNYSYIYQAGNIYLPDKAGNYFCYIYQKWDILSKTLTFRPNNEKNTKKTQQLAFDMLKYV